MVLGDMHEMIVVHVRRGTWRLVRYLVNPRRRGTLVEAELDEIHLEVQHDGLDGS